MPTHTFVVTPSPIATGTIHVSRFVAFDSAIDRGAAQAGAGAVRLWGVSGPAQYSPPGGPYIGNNIDGVLALAGRSFEVFGDGSSEVPLEIGAVAVAAGVPLKPDANGRGVLAESGSVAGAVSMAAVDAGANCPVWVKQPFTVP